jgi:signal transduction histidine kinase
MRYGSWARIRIGRLLVILVAVVLSLLLLIIDGLHFFPLVSVSPLDWARFGFSAFIAILYLAVGAMVWLFARDRRVAFLLFCFSFAMMVVFAVETAAVQTNDARIQTITDISSSLTLILFSILLLIFPNNYLTSHKQPATASRSIFQPGSRSDYSLLLRVYVAVLVLLSIITVLYSILHDLLSLHLPNWLHSIVNIYYLLVLIGILATITISYRQASSLRVRQQLRFFVIGVILAFTPFLFLTLLPQLFLPPRFMINAQVSTLTAVLLPLALGYSILRYQILVFDTYIRRAVAWIAGGVSLAVTGYLVVMLCRLLWSGNPVAWTISVVVALLILGPCVWWLAHVVTERLFFSEIVHYRRLVDSPVLLTRETFDLDEASELLAIAVVNAFEMQEVCLLVLDEDTGYYRLSPALKQDDPDDASRERLVQHLLLVGGSATNENARLPQHADWLGVQGPIIENIAHARRPLLLSEASKAGAEQPAGLARYLATTISDRPDPLLAPVRAQGKMIGILVLGERADHEPFAGPDFEVIDLITTRFAPVLETARLYEQASQHVATLDTLYSASATLEKAYQSIEEVASAYATVAAGAVTAGAEVWLYDEADRTLRHVTHLGSGPRLTPLESLTSLQEYDWTARFYDGNSAQSGKNPSADVPPCLAQTPSFPFAWIPLAKGQQHYGILVLTYQRPHIFSQEEQRVLGMFANQCAAAMENAQITIALRSAYEGQKELDRLKDQFIMTASHELRTPLTAVQGYIDLLDHYNTSLSTEERSDFIAKAQRGSDELALLISNIMDVSRVDADVEQVRLSKVSLANSVQHILEILEAITRQENRDIHVDMPAQILVLADELRLRQVLLNLVGNALKYSPAGSRIDIAAGVHGEEVMFCVRDFGLGVSPGDQGRLFKRFVRLERDMNSPVRGAGLGLYISKRLIEAMGGRIWVESSGKPGDGSIFAFTLKCVVVGEEIGTGLPTLPHAN